MTIRSRCLLPFILGAIVSSRGIYAAAYSNIYGNDLNSCSSSDMALTGYTRTGYCVDQNNDSGSHHVCIDLSSTATESNFCEVTGQNDWCSEYMQCHDSIYVDDDNADDEEEYCPVQNWCVCQWAFASYIQKAGGCGMIQDIVCESINQEAVIAYKKSAGVDKYREALECLAERCGISVGGFGKSAAAWASIFAIAAGITAAFVYYSRKQSREDVVETAAVGYVEADKCGTIQ